MQGHCPVCLLPPAPTTVLLYMCNSIIPVCSDHLIYPSPTTQLLHMHEHCPVCSDNLMCPCLTTVLLHMQEHHFCVLQPFNVPCSDHSASAHARGTVVRPGHIKWSEHTGKMLLHVQKCCGQSRRQ